MIETREKLRRFLRAFDITQDKADEIAGVKEGRTYSFTSGRSNQIKREYLEPLAAHTGISVDWFFDGKDDFPLSSTSTTGSEIELPVVGEVPSSRDVAETILDTVRQARPKNAPMCRYRRIAEDILPYFRKGDLVLINPTDQPRATVIGFIEDGNSGVQAVYHMVRVAGEIKLRVLSDEQSAPPEWWKLLGIAIDVRRTLANGLVVSYACDTGLTPDMLTI